MKRFILWLLFKQNRGLQKEVAVEIFKNIQESEDSSIDNATAETMITLAVKSVGNKITSFIIKDK